ncbi:MlaD family protein [Paraburkholderia sp. A2WS-5]|uniref:MlaD family protein n=1 Tax=unclassified Paraburkholderia TaxID=2615204 RepID=UPI003B7A920E
MTDARSRRTQAEVRRSAWPGWIWAVPIAAICVTGWLGVQALVHKGETVTVGFDNAYGMAADETIVTLHGVKVGQVSSVALTPDGRRVEAKLEIDRKDAPYLRAGTQFFLRGAELDLSDPASMKALLSGPEIVMEPGRGKPATHFDGAEHRPALAPLHGPMVSYAVRFEGAAGELKSGANVQLRGFCVGTVTGVRLNYDAGTGALSTLAQLALDPSRLGIAGVAAPANGDWRPIVDTMLERLIARGLRARLMQDPPLVGPRKVVLDFVKTAPAATLTAENGVPVIPDAPSADLDAIAAQANDVVAKIDALPIKETGDQVRSIAAHVDALSNSPQIRESLTHIDRSVAQIDRTLQQVSPQVGPLVAQLRETAKAVDSTVAAANRTLGGDVSSQDDLPAALRELSDAARSVRTLADYLDRHPEALARGRPEE